MSPLNVFSLVTPKLPIQCKRQPTKIFHIKTCLAHAHARKFINELLLYTKHLRLYIPNLQFLVHFLQKFHIREKNILTNSKYSTFGKHCLHSHSNFAPLKYAVVLLQIKTIYYNRRLHTVTYSRKKRRFCNKAIVVFVGLCSCFVAKCKQILHTYAKIADI